MVGFSVSFDDEVAVLTLSTPLNNRFGVEVMGDLDHAIDELTGRMARAVLLCADSPDFSHGGDERPSGKLEAQEINAIFERYMDGFNRLERLPIPVIAAVQGLCDGGGVELVLRRYSIRERERALQPFGTDDCVRHGARRHLSRRRTGGPPSRLSVGSYVRRNSRLVFAQHGLVNYIVPDASLRAQAPSFAKRIAKGPTLAHGTHKAGQDRNGSSLWLASGWQVSAAWLCRD